MKQMLLAPVSLEQKQNKKEKIVIEPELLWALHWGNQYVATKIARLFNCTSGTIFRKFKKLKIPLGIKREPPNKIVIEPELLLALYWGNQYSSIEIAKLFRCTPSPIVNKLKINHIPRRTFSESTKLYAENNNAIYKDKNWLTEQYWGFDLFTTKMTELAGCKQNSTISKWMRKYNIPLRTNCIMPLERDGTGHKQCRHCGKWKSELEFTSDKTTIDTLSKSCMFCNYIWAAKHRNLSFSLTQEQFRNLIFSPCHYCGGTSNGHTNGIDRLDSSKGYEIDNAISSCTTDNVMKSNKTRKKFAEQISKVYHHWAKDFLKEVKH